MAAVTAVINLTLIEPNMLNSFDFSDNDMELLLPEDFSDNKCCKRPSVLCSKPCTEIFRNATPNVKQLCSGTKAKCIYINKKKGLAAVLLLKKKTHGT